MKKIIIIGTVLAVVVGAGIFFTRGSSPADEIKKVVEDSSNEIFKGSLKAAVEMDVPMKCTYEVAGFEYEGMVKGDKYRASQTYQGKEQQILMVGECMYTWDDTKEGLKICFDNEEETVWDQTGDNLPDNIICKPAVIADSAFNLPNDVNFMTLEDLMMGAGVDLEQMGY